MTLPVASSCQAREVYNADRLLMSRISDTGIFIVAIVQKLFYTKLKTTHPIASSNQMKHPEKNMCAKEQLASQMPT